jgi:hypothetical protein
MRLFFCAAIINQQHQQPEAWTIASMMNVCIVKQIDIISRFFAFEEILCVYSICTCVCKEKEDEKWMKIKKKNFSSISLNVVSTYLIFNQR